MLRLILTIAIFAPTHFTGPSTATSTKTIPNTITPSPSYQHVVSTEYPHYNLEAGAEESGFESFYLSLPANTGQQPSRLSRISPGVWNSRLRTVSPSSLPGQECRMVWIEKIDSHMKDIYSSFNKLSTVFNSWTQFPCTTTTRLTTKPSTINTYTSDLPVACDNVIRRLVTYNVTTLTVQEAYTNCAMIFSTMRRSLTTTTSVLVPPLRLPWDGKPSCKIPLETCGVHWKAFRDHFMEYKNFDWNIIWTNDPRVERNETILPPQFSKTQTSDTFDLEKFLDFFQYLDWENLFGECPEAKLDMLDICIQNLAPDESEIFQDALISYRRQVSEVSEFQNASYRLQELESILGCDLYVDKFALQPYELPRWHGRRRDICADGGWGESAGFQVGGNVTAVPLSQIVFTASDAEIVMYSQVMRANKGVYTRSGSWTITSPSVYLAYNTLAAIHPCEWTRGGMAEYGIITMHPKDLSSIVPNNHMLKKGVWAYKTRSFNQADLNGMVPEKALSASLFLKKRAEKMIMRISEFDAADTPKIVDTRRRHKLEQQRDEIKEISSSIALSLYTFTDISDYNPMVALPTQILNEADGIFASCRPYKWHPNISSSSWVIRGIWDPPLPQLVQEDATIRPAGLPESTPVSNILISSSLAGPSAVHGPGVPKLPQITGVPSSSVFVANGPQSLMKGNPGDLHGPAPVSNDSNDWAMLLYGWIVSHTKARTREPDQNFQPDKAESSEAAVRSSQHHTNPAPLRPIQTYIHDAEVTIGIYKADPPDIIFKATQKTFNILELHDWRPSMHPNVQGLSSETLMDVISTKLQQISSSVSQYVPSLPTEFLELWNSVYYWVEKKNKASPENITNNTDTSQPRLVSHITPTEDGELATDLSSNGVVDFGKGVYVGTSSRNAPSGSSGAFHEIRMAQTLLLLGLHVLYMLVCM